MVNMKLWVVDDEPDVAESVVESLKFLGHTASSAISARELIAAAPTADELVVLDLNMPGMDGLQVLRELAAVASFPAVVMCSGMAPQLLTAARDFARISGFRQISWLTKPVTLENLSRALQQATEPAPAPRTARPSTAPPHDAAFAPISEFVPFFQPKTDIRSGLLKGFELLVRWKPETSMVLGPGQFLPALRTAGRMAELTHHLIDAGLDLLAAWHPHNGEIGCAFNVEAGLIDGDMPDRLDEACARRGVPNGLVTIEVTEGELLSSAQAGLESLTRLRLRGFDVSMDDFGTGYSSLSRLANFPFSEIKLDVGFVSRIGSDPATEAIIAESIELAHRLGMRVCAEGVEQLAQLHWLADRHCDLAQGFLLGMPMPADHATALSRQPNALVPR